MKHRDLTAHITQSDLEYATQHWQEYGAILTVMDVIGCPPQVKSIAVSHEETPSVQQIADWATYGCAALQEGKRLLIFCDDGQCRSPTVAALIQCLHEQRSFWKIVDEYHRLFLKEEQPHNWLPFAHWADALCAYLQADAPALAVPYRPQPKVQLGRLPGTFLDYRFRGFRQLESDLMDEGWDRPDYFASLYTYAHNLEESPLIVEIGTYFGSSAIVMAHAVREKRGHVISIDPALRKEGAQVIDEDHLPAKFFASPIHEICQDISAQRLDGYITLIPDYSEGVLARWDDREISMLFVDGAHTYKEVAKDCQWMPHVKPGGYAVFDDWLAGVERAVKEYIADKPEWKMVYESTQQRHGHYCVTILQKDFHAAE